MALKALGQVPEIRAREAEELKAKIASGQYNVDAGEVADSILDGLAPGQKGLDNSIIGDEGYERPVGKAD